MLQMKTFFSYMVERSVERDTAQAMSTSGLDSLLSGGGFDAPAVSEEDYTWMSARGILECSSEHKKCKFQGMILACDMEPRKIESNNDTSRRRRNQPIETKIADLLLIDKTGPINASLWNGLADEICAVWRSISDAKKNRRQVSAIVELSKVRIQAARKSDWNGELLSQMRSLVSIAPCEGEAGTSIQVKSTATAPNMMTSLYSVPSECAICAIN